MNIKNSTVSGSTLAIAAVSLALSGTVLSPAKAATPGKVHCFGVNSCRAKSDCHTPKNACKGMNACKARGWLNVESEKACTDAGGKILD
jgi:uncharacterized membrane protein